MGFFNKYPYTDFHELNLDWFLTKFKALQDQMDLLTRKVNDILNRLKDKPDLPVVHQRDITISKRGRLLCDRLADPTLQPPGGQAVVFYGNRWYSAGQRGSSGPCYLTSWTADGQIIAQNSHNDAGHGNGMAVLDEQLYVTGPLGTICVYDLDLNLVDSIDCTDYLYNTLGACAYKHDLYFYGRSADDQANYMRIVKYSNGNLTLQCDFPAPINRIKQGFCVYDGKGYALFNKSNQIYQIDLLTGNIDAIYNVPDGDLTWPTGEIENLFIRGGNIWINSALYYPNRYGSYASYNDGLQSVLVIFETDILKPCQGDNTKEYMDAEYNFNVTLNSDAAYTFNPGLTVTTALEAACLLNYRKYGQLFINKITAGDVICLTGVRGCISSVDDPQTIGMLQLVNCDLIMYNTPIRYLWAKGTVLTANRLLDQTLIGVELNSCKVIFNSIDMRALELFSQRGCDIEINHIKAGTIPDVFSSPTPPRSPQTRCSFAICCCNSANLQKSKQKLAQACAHASWDCIYFVQSLIMCHIHYDCCSNRSVRICRASNRLNTEFSGCCYTKLFPA